MWYEQEQDTSNPSLSMSGSASWLSFLYAA